MTKVKSALAPAGPGGHLGGSKWRRLRENYPFFIMVFPAVLVVFLFNYLPIYGVLIAFQDFMPGDKIFSPIPGGWASTTSSGFSPMCSSGP